MTTNKDTALTTSQDYFNPQAWEQMSVMAGTFIKSRAIPVYYQTPEQVITALQTGYEMGMKPMEALKSFYIVNGILTLYGAATIKRLRDHGWKIQYDESGTKPENGGSVTATVTKGEEKYTETFTYKQAEMSGYVRPNSPGWKEGQNRRLKLRYGVISMIIKTYIPEVLGSAVDIAEVAEDIQIKTLPDLPPVDSSVEEGETVDNLLPENPPELPEQK